MVLLKLNFSNFERMNRAIVSSGGEQGESRLPLFYFEDELTISLFRPHHSVVFWCSVPLEGIEDLGAFKMEFLGGAVELVEPVKSGGNVVVRVEEGLNG
jgi:hypothetical protein